MDPVTAQALADLKDLLRDKVITLAQWREEVAYIHSRSQAARPAEPPPKAVGGPPPTAEPRDEMDEKHNGPPDGPSTLTDAELNEWMRGRLLDDDEPALEHKDDSGREHKEPEAPEAEGGVVVLGAPEHDEPARFYRATFRLQFFEWDALRQNTRRAGHQIIRGWGHLDRELYYEVNDIYANGLAVQFDRLRTLPIARAFGWGETHENYSSIVVELSITNLEEVADGSHEAGSWNAADVKLTRRGPVQPTLGCPAGRFVRAGGDIARPEFYREDSCMLSLFLESWADRLVTYRADLTPAGLYRMATGSELVEGQPAGVSLREAEKWLAHWRLSGRAINVRGELVWRYDPPSLKKNVPGGSVWRLLVHDEHVWLIDREVKEFDRAVTAKDARVARARVAQNIIPTAADISASLSSRWRRPPKPTGVPPTFVSSVADVLAAATDCGDDVTTVVTNGSVEELAVALWNAGYEPGSLRLDKGAIDSFTVRIGECAVRVGPAIESAAAADQLVTQALTARSQVVFEEHLARGRAAFQPIDGLSTYSGSLAAAFRTYTRGPRVGVLGEVVAKDTPCVEFDVSRAYTSFLAEIKQVPVFSAFDEVYPYDGTDVEPLSFYLVRVPELDGLLFPRRCDFVPGATVAYARTRGIAVELMGVARPCRLVETNGSAALRAFYDDAELPDKARKDVANIIYGLANKGRNRKQIGVCYLDEAEARKHGGYLMKLGPGSVAVKQGAKDLTEGYLPVGRLVLDAMRRRLHATVVALGGDAIAVKCDAVFVRAEHGERAAAALRAAGLQFAGGTPTPGVVGAPPLPGRSGWDVVGSLKQLPKPLPELKPLPLDESPAAVRPVPLPVCDRIHLLDEEATRRGEWGEVDALMPTRQVAEPAAAPMQPRDDYDDMSALIEDMMADFAAAAPIEPPAPTRGPIAIEAAVPGAGKTYLVRKWLKRTGQKGTAVIVCPWNALVTQLVKKGYRAITLHELVGRLAVETEDGRDLKKAYNLEGVTHIHFEEAYLYPVHQVGWMAAFIKEHPTITYSMAGDPGQLAPVRQDLCVDSDAWYEQAFAKMFPRRICLRVSKRVDDPSDRARMFTLCDELRAETRPAPAILLDAGLRVVRFDELTEEAARYPHLAAMRSTMARVDHWAHALVGETFADEYAIGQELYGVDGVRCRGGRIASNETYTITEVDDAGLTLAAPDGSQRVVTLEQAKRYLKRPYCRTGHSTQGLSLGNRIYIHDWRSAMATHRWLRTAVSRCGTLDIILVDGSEGLRNNFHVNAARIEAHRVADEAKGFSWDVPDYVDPKWVADTLRRQRYSCWACGDPLDQDWSIDRIANELPHTRGNCAVSCRRCQHASAHRE